MTITVDVQVIEKTPVFVPEAFQNPPSPTRSAATTQANSPNIATPRPPNSSSALGFPRPAPDSSSAIGRQLGQMGSRAYQTAPYVAGQVARLGVEAVKGIGKGVAINQVEQAIQGWGDAIIDDAFGVDNRDQRFEDNPWSPDSRQDSSAYNEAYEAQQRIIQRREQWLAEQEERSRQIIDDLSREAVEAWEELIDEGSNALDGLSELAQDLAEQLRRELEELAEQLRRELDELGDDFLKPSPNEDPFPNPLEPFDDTEFPPENPPEDPTEELPEEPAPEDWELPPEPGGGSYEEREVEEPEPDPSIPSSIVCPGWGLFELAVSFQASISHGGRVIDGDEAQPYGNHEMGEYKRYVWLENADYNIRKKISIRRGGSGANQFGDIVWRSYRKFYGFSASRYQYIGYERPEYIGAGPIGETFSTANHPFLEEFNGLFDTPRNLSISSANMEQYAPGSFGWVKDYSYFANYNLKITMLSCSSLPPFHHIEPIPTPSSNGSRNQNMSSCCSCDSIKAMLKSLKQTLSIPVVSCEFNEDTNLWEPKVEQKEIEIFTLDEKTALGMGELYRQQAEMAIAQCEAKNGAAADINAALGFPVTVPKYLNDGKEEEEEVTNLVELYRNWIQIFDGLMGEFPVKMQITTDEGQEHPIELMSVADALGDLAMLAVPTYYDADNVYSLQIKSLIEQAKSLSLLNQTFYLLFSVSEQLGFNINKIPTTLELPFNPNFPDDWSQFNQNWTPEEPNAYTYENADSATIKGILLELGKTLAPIHGSVAEKLSPIAITEKAKKLAEILSVGRELGLGEVLADVLNQNWDGVLDKLSKQQTDKTPEIKVRKKDGLNQ